MEFEYRLISEKRCNEIDSWQIKDPYGYRKKLSARGKYWITNEDESILFCRAFMPRHDDLEGNRISYLFLLKNSYYFVDFRCIDIRDYESNGDQCRFMNIEIVEEDFIEEYQNKKSLLKLLKELISAYEEKHIRVKHFKRKFVFEFYYKGERI